MCKNCYELEFCICIIVTHLTAFAFYQVRKGLSMFRWPHKFGKQNNISAPTKKFPSPASQSQRGTAIVGLAEKFTVAELNKYMIALT